MLPRQAQPPARQARRLYSIVDLLAASNRFVAETDANRERFTSNADPEGIMAAVQRRQEVLDPTTS
jgi:hypothetical protein